MPQNDLVSNLASHIDLGILAGELASMVRIHVVRLTIAFGVSCLLYFRILTALADAQGVPWPACFELQMLAAVGLAFLSGLEVCPLLETVPAIYGCSVVVFARDLFASSLLGRASEVLEEEDLVQIVFLYSRLQALLPGALGLSVLFCRAQLGFLVQRAAQKGLRNAKLRPLMARSSKAGFVQNALLPMHIPTYTRIGSYVHLHTSTHIWTKHFRCRPTHSVREALMQAGMALGTRVLKYPGGYWALRIRSDGSSDLAEAL